MRFPLLIQYVVFCKKIDVQKETVVENYTSAGTAIFQDGSEFYFRLCHRYRRMKIRENPSEMPPLAYLLVSSRTSRETGNLLSTIIMQRHKKVFEEIKHKLKVDFSETVQRVRLLKLNIIITCPSVFFCIYWIQLFIKEKRPDNNCDFISK